MTSPNSPADGELTDAEAVRAALDGADRAYTLLMRRYKSPLYRFALRHLGDADDAEDAVQDAFIAAYNNLHRYKPQYQFSTWLYQITLNKCRDIGRRRKTRAFMQRLTPQAENLVADEARLSSPEVQLQARSELQYMQARIADLPKALKPAFILCVMQEKTQKETAKILRLSPKAVELRVYRARQMLKNQLAEKAS